MDDLINNNHQKNVWPQCGVNASMINEVWPQYLLFNQIKSNQSLMATHSTMLGNTQFLELSTSTV